MSNASQVPCPTPPRAHRWRALRKALFSVRNDGLRKIVTVFGKRFEMRRAGHINRAAVLRRLRAFKGRAVAPAGAGSPRLVVSLTSFPERMGEIGCTLYSLFKQSHKPDAIVLWLSESDFPNREASLPADLLALRAHGLSICWCANLGSFRKLVPALAAFPDDIIVTADDDLYYRRDWLKHLYADYLAHPRCIVGHRVHRIVCEDGHLAPYEKWRKNVKERAPSVCNVATTGSGALFPPHCLHPDAVRDDIFMRVSPKADDIWFWAMAALAGTPTKVAKHSDRRILYVNLEREFGDAGTRLSRDNMKGGNDAQAAALLSTYPPLRRMLETNA